MAARKNVTKDAAPGSPAALSEPGDDGGEVAEERVEVVTYAAAIDVAKGFGMVCTRVPGSRPDRKRQAVWQADADYASVVTLMDHLRCQGIQRLVLESTGVIWGLKPGDIGHRPGRAAGYAPVTGGRDAGLPVTGWRCWAAGLAARDAVAAAGSRRARPAGRAAVR